MTDAVREFLEEPRFAVLASINPDGTPQQTVMWYELQDHTILMNTAAGRVKVANLERDSRISICIEDEYCYVTITGRAELDDEQDRAQADIARLAHRYHDFERADALIQKFRQQHRITIRMSIEQVVANGV